MSIASIPQITPQIAIRVPGPWRTGKELGGRLSDGYRLEGDYLVTPAGLCVGIEAKPADQMFPSIFRSACRRWAHGTELDRLDRYKLIACAVLPGGSTVAAEQVLEVAASLIRAGGVGVFIDNSVRAHGGADWLELANNRHDADAVFYTFINIVKSVKEVASCGMHVLGHRDAVICHASELEKAVFSLEEFLRSCAKQGITGEAREFSDTQGRRFRLLKEPHRHSFSNHHPVHNPYGRWRLHRIET